MTPVKLTIPMVPKKGLNLKIDFSKGKQLKKKSSPLTKRKTFQTQLKQLLSLSKELSPARNLKRKKSRKATSRSKSNRKSRSQQVIKKK